MRVRTVAWGLTKVAAKALVRRRRALRVGAVAEMARQCLRHRDESRSLQSFPPLFPRHLRDYHKLCPRRESILTRCCGRICPFRIMAIRDLNRMRRQTGPVKAVELARAKVPVSAKVTATDSDRDAKETWAATIMVAAAAERAEAAATTRTPMSIEYIARLR